MNESKIPTRAEIFNAVDALGQTVQDLSERILKIEERTNKQEDRNRNIIIAVLVAAVLIVAATAVQVFFTEKDDRARSNQLLEQVQTAQMSAFATQEKLDSLKICNPYLK